jgi:hypothetical protein
MKYALIGCGRIAVNHMKAVAGNDLELVALCHMIVKLYGNAFPQGDLVGTCRKWDECFFLLSEVDACPASLRTAP